MNVFVVVLAILALGAVGTLAGALVRRRKARGLTDISGSGDALAEQQAAKRVEDMRAWRYGLLHSSGRAAPLPPRDSV
jgi:type II secretory pathway pseudopilin PulG